MACRIPSAIQRKASAVPARVAKTLFPKQRAQRCAVRVNVAEADLSVAEDAMSPEEYKAALLDSFWSTERGLNASSETRAEINELITQLEAVTPIPNPTENMEALGGYWKLVYTSNSELMALLALSKLPLIEVEEISQAVDTITGTLTNKLSVSSPVSRSTFEAVASFEVRSPKRIQLRFEKGSLGTPELNTDVELPASTTVFGQSVDLTALKSIVNPLQAASKDAMKQVANLIEQQPNLDFPITSERAQSWLLVTYLDDTLRISRGDGGSVFVLVKQAEPLTTWEGPAAVTPNVTVEDVIVELPPDDDEDESDDTIVVIPVA